MGACRMKWDVIAVQAYLSLVGISQEVAEQLVEPLTKTSHSTADTSRAVQQYKALGFTITEHMQVSIWSLQHAASSLLLCA